MKAANRLVLALLIGFTAQAYGQVRIESGGKADTRTRIAVPPAVVEAGLEDAGQEITKVIAYDLNFSGLFNVLDSQYYPPGFRNLPGDASRIDLAAWKTTPVESLVYVKLRRQQGKDGKVIAECRLFDVSSAQQVVGRELKASLDWTRLMGHQFSDQIVLAASGVSGIATSQICFSQHVGSNKEIFVSDYDGAGIRQVTRHNSISIKPKFSPDGKKIAYVSYKDKGQYLYVLDLASGESRSLSAKPGMNSAPAWAPDGKSLAIALSRDGNPEIYLVNADGSGLRRLTRERAVDTSPTFSPDGKRIAFVSERLGSPQIFVMDLKGQNVQRLSYQGGSAYDPVWSPNGKWIAYVGDVPGDGQEIYLLDPTNKQNYWRLTDSTGGNESPSWSVDSRHLIFGSTRSGSSALYTLNVEDCLAKLRAHESTDAQRVPGIKNGAQGPFWGPRR